MLKKSAVKKVTRKFSKAGPREDSNKEAVSKVESSQAPATKSCFFCKTKVTPSYTDMEKIKRYVTDRNRILPKLRSGLCAKHQRVLTKQIKYARHLALLPFTPKV